MIFKNDPNVNNPNEYASRLGWHIIFAIFGYLVVFIVDWVRRHTWLLGSSKINRTWQGDVWHIQSWCRWCHFKNSWTHDFLRISSAYGMNDVVGKHYGNAICVIYRAVCLDLKATTKLPMIHKTDLGHCFVILSWHRQARLGTCSVTDDSPVSLGYTLKNGNFTATHGLWMCFGMLNTVRLAKLQTLNYFLRR